MKMLIVHSIFNPILSADELQGGAVIGRSEADLWLVQRDVGAGVL